MTERNDLLDQISLRMPLVWLHTDEPTRATEKIAEESGRVVFRLDAIEGLLEYNKEDREWLNVIQENPDGTILPIVDTQDAFAYVLDQVDAIVLLQGDEKSVEKMTPFFFSQLFRFRESFFEDDAEKTPTQFVILTHEEKIPAQFARLASRAKQEMPDVEDFEKILHHMSNEVSIKDDPNAIAIAGLGLSENEFIGAALTGARKNGHISTSFITEGKKKILKENNVLDVRKPKLTVDDLGGLDLAKDLINRIGWMWNNQEQVKDLGLTPLRRLLMVGVPGVGKSLVCEAIASMLDVDLGKGGVSNSMSKWVGESEQNMRRTFATLQKMAPIVFWIDEFGRDLSGGSSSAHTDGGTTDRVHGEFLTGLQELPENVFLAAAANRIDDLAPEMLRADRFDRVMFCGFPTVNERIEIFRIHLKDEAKNHDLEKLAEMTDFFTGAEIKALIQEVKFEVGTTSHRPPTTSEIEKAIPEVRGRVWVNHLPAIGNMYHRAMTEWHWASSGQKKDAERVLATAKNGGKPLPVSRSYTPKNTGKSMMFGNNR